MTAAERRWLAGMIGLITLLTSAPHLIGLLGSTAAHPYSGALLLPGDVFSYYAKMRLGAGGAWLFQNVYAVEPHSPAPLYLVYLLLGRLASIGADARVPLIRLVIVYHASRAVLGIVLLALLYRVIALILPDPPRRRLAWALIALGGGLGWLMLLLAREPLPLGSLPLDLYLGEASTMVPLLALPHVLLARAALLGGLLLLAAGVERGDWRRTALGGACWLLAVIGVPFYIAVAGGIAGGWALARLALTRAVPWRLLIMAAAAGLPGALLAIATLFSVGGDPVYSAWAAQNRLPLPHPLHLIALAGLQAALAIPGAIHLWRERPAHTDLFLGWVVAAPLLWLIPLPFRLRLIEGFMIPLTTLAVLGLYRLAAPRGLPAIRAAAAALLSLLLPSGLFLLVGAISLSALGGAYLPPDRAAVMDWLRVNARPGAVVLSAESAGVQLPAAAPVRSLVGHAFETPDFAGKERLVADWFRGDRPPDALQSYGVTYIWVGPEEGALAGGAFDPGDLPLRVVAASGEFVLYEVVRP